MIKKRITLAIQDEQLKGGKVEALKELRAHIASEEAIHSDMFGYGSIEHIVRGNIETLQKLAEQLEDSDAVSLIELLIDASNIAAHIEQAIDEKIEKGEILK